VDKRDQITYPAFISSRVRPVKNHGRKLSFAHPDRQRQGKGAFSSHPTEPALMRYGQLRCSNIVVYGKVKNRESNSLVTATNEQVNEARELLRRFLRPTRLVQAERLGRDSDTRLNLKLEIDLPTGSFKPRGAIYALMKSVERRSRNGERPIRGVV